MGVMRTESGRARGCCCGTLPSALACTEWPARPAHTLIKHPPSSHCLSQRLTEGGAGAQTAGGG
eukprot:1564062-Rhodomonas_salina.3